MKQLKALVLFSGGLDSRLALKLIQDQLKDNVEAVHFILPFGGGCCNNFSCVFNYTQIQGVKLHVIDFTKKPLLTQYIKMIQSPKHGTGTAMNPCKDCKIFMLKQAKKLANKINAEIIVTGEVLGQRPMSQIKHQLLLTEKQSDLQGKLLRPLSAKLLPETDAEKKGLIDRSKFLSIQGRNRKQQMKLAEKHKIKYPSSGGGCLLCEKEYCIKLKDLFKNTEVNKLINQHIQLLSIGRHFRDKGKIILGKNKQENDLLELLNKKLKFNILMPKTPGPTVLFENKQDKTLAKQLLKAYSKDSKISKNKFEKYKLKIRSVILKSSC